MNNSACISSIQHFSTDDGDGIRTTVFFQGCNLNCPWCHNPETQGASVMLISENACIGCGTCMTVCAQNAHKYVGSRHVHDMSSCIRCGICEKACPSHALRLSGVDMSEDEVFAEIRSDLPFYKDGGGVTFSGGEPLLQYEFCTALAKRCKAENIGVIIDTAGCVPYENFLSLLPYVDGFYFDFKSTQDKAGIIGADYELIAENLISLSSCAKVTLRVPIIPRFNDNSDFITELSALLEKTNVKEVHFLPFHRLGFSKYEALGIENKCLKLNVPDKKSILGLTSSLSDKYTVKIK